MKQITKTEAWNAKVEFDVGAVTTSDKVLSDAETEANQGESNRAATKPQGLVHQGRSMFAGGLKGRQATLTPRLRERTP